MSDDQDRRPSVAAAITDYDFERLLVYLKQTRGFDFTGYKRSSLMRRVGRRMQVVGVAEFTAYTDYLEVHPEEFNLLFNTILINVTSFFRDSIAWETLQTEIIPALLDRKSKEDPIRVWCAGCASGQEAYTLTMLLAEAMGIDAFRDRVKIYATDVDDEALSQARQASYSEREVAGVPEPLREKYFEKVAGHYSFHKDLRRAVIFGRHDLIQDAPISRVDLLTCRNTLMYFNAEVQSRIMTRFHFALNDDGCLFLGKAEILFTHASLFVPVDLKRRIFRRASRPNPRERLLFGAQNGERNTRGDDGNEDEMDQMTQSLRLRDAVFDTGPIAQLVVDSAGALALVNERARELFRLHPRDLGRPLQDLEISYRPLELRSCIDQAYAERRPILVSEVPFPPGARQPSYLDVQISPLFDTSGGIPSRLVGASVTFTDVTRYRRLQEALEQSNRELETAYEELQSTNEELETSNEELQSTVEELETTNEELQSTNEEMETMNEELQSTNEELQTMNEELRDRSSELNRANSFLSSILASLRSGVAVLDRDLRVTIWNHQAEELWGVRSDEVIGRHLLGIDIGLPIEPLIPPMRASLAGEGSYTVIDTSAVNRRGKSINCRVTALPLTDPTDGIHGIILLMEDIEQNR